MTYIILKPNEIADFAFGERLTLSVNGRKNDPDVTVPTQAFLFRQNTSARKKDGHLFGRGTIVGASCQDDGKWSFEFILEKQPVTQLRSEQLHHDVIDQTDEITKEIAEVRRLSWTRFFKISDEASAKLNTEHFGD